MPCNVDIATQEILKLAEAADPEGTRTMGVLTKPDLATETATRDAVMDLVLGRRRSLKLGYYLVKNRSADDSTSTFAQRTEAEKAFFMAPPWSSARERCGVAALKDRLRQLLSKISNQELPHVKAEISQRLNSCKAELESMGPARANESSQRLYLGKLATRFHTVAHAALNGHYTSENIFRDEPDLRLITRIIGLCEGFSNTVWARGHSHHFLDDQNDKVEKFFRDETGKAIANIPPGSVGTLGGIPSSTYPELHDVIPHEDYVCPEPSSDTIMPLIRKIFNSSRGPELGTVCSSLPDVVE